ncbi:hypothetical protein F4X88_09915 [Candidatus Poribacteria bacterium]|nr:hypothetical protein [Candidatus Poribacteria bacterium]
MRMTFLLVFFFVCFESFVFAELPIRVMYWKSSDVEAPSQTDLDSVYKVMVEVQAFFGSEMERHGFGAKTFNFNRDIRVIEGKLRVHQYTSVRVIQNESSLIEFGLDNQIYVVFLGRASRIDGGLAVSQQLCATAPEQLKYCNNLIVIPMELVHHLEWLTAHEIGHAFSLGHPSSPFIKNRVNVMSSHIAVPVGVKNDLKNYAISREDAVFLDKADRLFIQQVSQEAADAIDVDVNNDGYVDLSDVLIVRSAIQNSVSYDTDVNNDGKTDEIDVLMVKAKAHAAIAAAAPSYPKKRLRQMPYGKLSMKWAELKVVW